MDSVAAATAVADAMADMTAELKEGELRYTGPQISWDKNLVAFGLELVTRTGIGVERRLA